MYEGLLCARQYFTKDTPDARNVRNKVLCMWEGVEWNWFTQGQNVLYWHWNPNNGWSMNHQLHGWNEALTTYVLAAGSPRYAIDKAVYNQGWATGPDYLNGNTYYGHQLPLGPALGGGPVLLALLVFGPQPPRPEGRARRLLGAEQKPHAHQPRLLLGQPQAL